MARPLKRKTILTLEIKAGATRPPSGIWRMMCVILWCTVGMKPRANARFRVIVTKARYVADFSSREWSRFDSDGPDTRVLPSGPDRLPRGAALEHADERQTSGGFTAPRRGSAERMGISAHTACALPNIARHVVAIRACNQGQRHLRTTGATRARRDRACDVAGDARCATRPDHMSTTFTIVRAWIRFLPITYCF